MTRTEAVARRGWLGLLAAYAAWIIASPDAWHLPDFLNLPIHETGHLLFAWGGDVVAALGGTLLQLLLPAAIAISFHRRHDALGAATGAWWCGQSLFNVARYVADARTEALPLVGGGMHDWAFLLAVWGALDRDLAIARALRLLGTVVMGLALWHGWRHLPPAAPPDARGSR